MPLPMRLLELLPFLAFPSRFKEVSMQFNEIKFVEAVPIESYGPNFFRIAGKIIGGSVLIHGKGARTWRGVEDPQAVLDLRDQIDFVIFGTGKVMTAVPSVFRSTLEMAGIGVEPMITPSACRTYNVLVSEGRRVAAALLPL